MKKIITLAAICSLSIMLLILHVAAEIYFFYWTYWWYDIMMHGLGGLVIGALILWILIYEFSSLAQFIPLRFFGTTLLVLCIGIVWEVFEYSIGSQQYEVFDSYMLDTIMDVAMGVCGALLAFFISTKIA
jgi:hypothetical protein